MRGKFSRKRKVGRWLEEKEASDGERLLGRKRRDHVVVKEAGWGGLGQSFTFSFVKAGGPRVMNLRGSAKIIRRGCAARVA